MFADSLLDSSYSASRRRTWTAFVSFGAQAVAAAAMVILPLFLTEKIPGVHLTSELLLPFNAPPRIVPVSTAQIPTRGNIAEIPNVIVMPRSIPSIIRNDEGPSAPPAVGPAAPEGNRPESGSGPGNPMADVLSAFPAAGQPALARPLRISHVMEGNLMHRVQPAYPAAAKLAGLQGEVVLQATISRQGRVEEIAIVDGNPILARAAVAAVRQWLYRPYELNGEPVEVQTQITVNFLLGR